LGTRACRQGWALESEVIAQRVACILRAEQATPLQLGHYEGHEVVKVAGEQRRGEEKAVTGLGFKPGLKMIGDLRR
jgi:hypothetical protein